MIISQKGVSCFFHAERSDARSRSSFTGIFLLYKHSIISFQTAQVAQRIAILYIGLLVRNKVYSKNRLWRSFVIFSQSFSSTNRVILLFDAHLEMR